MGFRWEMSKVLLPVPNIGSVIGYASGCLPLVVMMQTADNRYLDHLGPGRLPLEHHQLMPQRQNFQGEIVPRAAERQRVGQNDPENSQHDLLTLLANPRQSNISSPDGISATHR